ncbi:TPA: cell division ATP-binding protein FtsE [Candidatus Berkelbacteria bacterium]|uniref:Cell division ATP-binding protein FtsE n=1 Tax=Berkelbacteria bacterium GW2011_GWE1_39_12 TaxID=1618337 RepID=A0A0G4B657_9BACT|nr:MAG: cell division ATPase, cell division transport system ATP-binding protein [Berkelbacteria bacterium GW2011_GWE1_39_12]HBO60412.1 cell division ATP-binding protein FtsE [Candidatus Berkelbacteria bacterium]
MIEIAGATKQYNTVKALDNINLKIARGEFVSIVGPSGAGKSTLIKMLTCEEKPTTGKILIADRNIAKLKSEELPYYRRKVGVVFQDFKLLPQKTVYENVAFALEVCDATDEEIKDRVPKILDLVGMLKKKDNLPTELSGGERQRVSIARALVHSPKILIADEPTGNLDPINSWEIIDLLLRINRQGTVVILATHNKEIVDRIKKRVLLMKGGKLISDRIKAGYCI